MKSINLLGLVATLLVATVPLGNAQETTLVEFDHNSITSRSSTFRFGTLTVLDSQRGIIEFGNAKVCLLDLTSGKILKELEEMTLLEHMERAMKRQQALVSYRLVRTDEYSELHNCSGSAVHYAGFVHHGDLLYADFTLVVFHKNEKDNKKAVRAIVVVNEELDIVRVILRENYSGTSHFAVGGAGIYLSEREDLILNCFSGGAPIDSFNQYYADLILTRDSTRIPSTKYTPSTSTLLRMPPLI